LEVAKAKTRYKAVIANQSYTIIGHESADHMKKVTQLVNVQLQEIRQLAPQTTTEEAAILLAINAVSDQLLKQKELLRLKKENEELKKLEIKALELENRLKRIDALEKEAKEALEKSGRTDVEITNHLEAQQILNEERKKSIQKKATKQ
jgi:cell division protein ZapA